MEDTNRADVYEFINEIRSNFNVTVIPGRGIKTQVIVGKHTCVYFDGYRYESAKECIGSGGPFVLVRFFRNGSALEKVVSFGLKKNKGEVVVNVKMKSKKPPAWVAIELIGDFIAMDDEVDASYHKP